MWHVANLFQKWFGIIKQLLPLSEDDMTICSPSTGYIALGLRPRAILPASGEQIVMSPSLKGNNCIMHLLEIYFHKAFIFIMAGSFLSLFSFLSKQTNVSC